MRRWPELAVHKLIFGVLATAAGAAVAHMRLGDVPSGGYADGAAVANLAAALTERTASEVHPRQVAILYGEQPHDWLGASPAMAVVIAGDVKAAPVSITESGVPLDLADPVNLVRSTEVRERLMKAEGRRVLYAVEADGMVTAVVHLEWRPASAPAGRPAWGWRLWRRTGDATLGLSSPGEAPHRSWVRHDIELARPARIVDVVEMGSRLRLTVDGRALEVDLDAQRCAPRDAATVFGGPVEVAEPRSWRHLARWVELSLARAQQAPDPAPAGEPALAPTEWTPAPGPLGGRGIETRVTHEGGHPIYLARWRAEGAPDGGLQLHIAFGAGGPEQPLGRAGLGRVPPSHRARVVALLSGPEEVGGQVEAGRLIEAPTDAPGVALDVVGRAALGAVGGWDAAHSLLQGGRSLVRGGEISAGLGDRARARCGALGITAEQHLLYAWATYASPQALARHLSAAGVEHAIALRCGPMGGLGWAPEGLDGPLVAAAPGMALPADGWRGRSAAPFFYLTAPLRGRADPGGRLAGLEGVVERVEITSDDVDLLRVDPTGLRLHLIPGLGERRPPEGAPEGLTLDRPPVAWLLTGAPLEGAHRGLAVNALPWSTLEPGRCTLAITDEGEPRVAPLGSAALPTARVGEWAVQGPTLIRGGVPSEVSLEAPGAVATALDARGRLMLAWAREGVEDPVGAVTGSLLEAGALDACLLGGAGGPDEPDAVRYFTVEEGALVQRGRDGSPQTLRLPPGVSTGVALTVQPGPPQPRVKGL